MARVRIHRSTGGCLIVAVVVFLLLAAAGVCFVIMLRDAWYEEDNLRRREPVENLECFRRHARSYLAAHENRYPEGRGVEGLKELAVLLSDLRLKDDRAADIDPDILREASTSYAYVASGLAERELEDPMPVIFEKPWGRERIRVLLSDGNIEVLEVGRLGSCREVVGHFRARAKKDSPAWETMIRNAEYIDRHHGRAPRREER